MSLWWWLNLLWSCGVASSSILRWNATVATVAACRWYRELCRSTPSSLSSSAKALKPLLSARQAGGVEGGGAKESTWWSTPFLLSAQRRVTPKLLRLSWHGWPLHFELKHGWGYFIPGSLPATRIHTLLSIFLYVSYFSISSIVSSSSRHPSRVNVISFHLVYPLSTGRPDDPNRDLLHETFPYQYAHFLPYSFLLGQLSLNSLRNTWRLMKSHIILIII